MLYLAHNDVYVVNSDGSNLTNLTNSFGNDHYPTWSPNGMQIAFQSSSDIYVVNFDGTGLINLTNSPYSSIHYYYPRWSNDGTKIAYSSEQSSDNDIYMMDADGTNKTRITDHADGQYVWLSWSPDGTKIAYAHWLDGLVIINADGTNQTTLVAGVGLAQDKIIAWSPDGSQIAFSWYRDHDGANGVKYYDIYTINADGTNEVRLTINASNNRYPSWSPDGTRIAFNSDRNVGFSNDIYVMNADGSNQTRLTSDVANEERPMWSPVGP